MISRSLLLNGAVSKEALQKFIQELAQRSDSPLVYSDGNRKYFTPMVAALIVDAIMLYLGESNNFLTIIDRAKLNPTGHIFPNTTPNL